MEMLLFALSALLLVCANATRCLEVRLIGLLDCSDLSLNTTRTLTYGKMYWVVEIILERNHIVYVNDTELLSFFPKLRFVDLRGNPNLDCRLVRKSKILMKSDCMTEIPRPDPPVVGKVTHNSIELYWHVNEADEEKPAHGKIRYCVQEEEVNMRNTGFGNVYSGYAKSHVFEGLEPQTQYRYRLRRSNAAGNSAWSVIITVNTTRKPKTSEDLIKAVHHKDLAKVDAILQELNQIVVDSPDKYGLSPLMIAAQEGSLDIVNKLLSYGADVKFQNSSGKDSLMLACFTGQLEISKVLVKHGASWDSQDYSGSTALHWAVDGDNIEVVRWLLSKGCRVDVKDHTSGWTPLMRLAMIGRNIHIARLLIQHGANISSMDKDGKSVLMMASLNGELDLVKLLIYKGADFTLLSVHNKTALDFARAFDRDKVVEYLGELWRGYKEKERRKQMDNWQHDEKYAQTVNLLKSARSMASAVDVTAELNGV